ncbi:hypothetical protein [Microtetraspora glauca]|uniref:Lycopene cyclase domain-containing protein n=1 Tax=Microtetraspora glauca TaxID=1996 RepID=A0ABV3GQ96_MICGL
MVRVDRDWRAGAVLLTYAAGWLPWFYYAIADKRTMYLFNALPMVPFMILAVMFACGLILGPAVPDRRRLIGSIAVGAFALLALADFWWLYPVIGGEVIPRSRIWPDSAYLVSACGAGPYADDARTIG